MSNTSTPSPPPLPKPPSLEGYIWPPPPAQNSLNHHSNSLSAEMGEILRSLQPETPLDMQFQLYAPQTHQNTAARHSNTHILHPPSSSSLQTLYTPMEGTSLQSSTRQKTTGDVFSLANSSVVSGVPFFYSYINIATMRSHNPRSFYQ